MIQALELDGCMFPGFALPHPDIDYWKCTMFTNQFFILQHIALTRSYRVTYQHLCDGRINNDMNYYSIN